MNNSELLEFAEHAVPVFKEELGVSFRFPSANQPVTPDYLVLDAVQVLGKDDRVLGSITNGGGVVYHIPRGEKTVFSTVQMKESPGSISEHLLYAIINGDSTYKEFFPVVREELKRIGEW